MDAMNSPEESVVGPKPVPSRISMVLAEEAKVRDAQRVQCPRVDQYLRLLAGKAKPARVTVCDDSHLLPSVEGTPSSPDLAGKLFPVVPAEILPPVCPVGPVGPCGLTSPSDLTSVGPVSPVSDHVGPRWARILHVARWARMGRRPRVTPGPVTLMTTFPQSHQDGGECMDMHGGWSDSKVAAISSSYGGSEGRIYCDRCFVEWCERWRGLG